MAGAGGPADTGFSNPLYGSRTDALTVRTGGSRQQAQCCLCAENTYM